ncbi:MAG: class I SAM-dependent methyltransferase [Pseudonocardiales bacterium]|nr:class I SAM-dependent methyltransferase [Pseudonocardiales bacterium]
MPAATKLCAISDGYAGAIDHYLSPTRHDAVKMQWEEPATRRLLDDVISHLAQGGTLRVLDIGCGVGDGLTLLRSAPRSRHRILVPGILHYTGLDLNNELLDAARWLHQSDNNARFIHGDVRDGIPDGQFDLFLSCGVPYSHLTTAELNPVLHNLFTAARTAPRPVAIIVDVLGRYSIEWTTHWDDQRWPYRMSFFSSGKPATSIDMTCYSGAELRTTMSTAAAQVGCPLSGIDCYDRSIMVGRHTTTEEFTPNLRPYRRLVNDLVNPSVEVDYNDLLFDVSIPDAPPPITQFFRSFSHSWNMLVTQVRDLSHTASNRDHVANVLQPMLAHGLERLEATTQQGLGVGHSLTAVAYNRPLA